MNKESSFLPELSTVAHARSLECLTDDEFWDYAFEAAHRSSHASVAHAEQYLLCEVGVGYCLLPLVSLREVIAPPAHYTKLPGVPLWMTGIMAWHGEIVVVVDLAAYLFGETAAPQTMLVIVQHNTVNVALSVTAISSRDGEERSMDALVLDTEALITEIIQQIGIFSPHA